MSEWPWMDGEEDKGERDTGGILRDTGFSLSPRENRPTRVATEI